MCSNVTSVISKFQGLVNFYFSNMYVIFSSVVYLVSKWLRGV